MLDFRVAALWMAVLRTFMIAADPLVHFRHLVVLLVFCPRLSSPSGAHTDAEVFS